MAGENEQDRVVSDEERTRQILEQLKSVHAFDLAYETIVGLVNFGSQKMGLLEETREVRDLDDARLSIELVRAILEVIERGPVDERTRGLHDALAQMQLAYAHAVQLDNAERTAGREGAPREERAAEADSAPRQEPAGEVEPEPREETAGGAAPAVDAAADAPEARPGEAEPAGRKPAAAKRPAAKKKPAPRKPAAKKKPAGEG